MQRYENINASSKRISTDCYTTYCVTVAAAAHQNCRSKYVRANDVYAACAFRCAEAPATAPSEIKSEPKCHREVDEIQLSRDRPAGRSQNLVGTKSKTLGIIWVQRLKFCQNLVGDNIPYPHTVRHPCAWRLCSGGGVARAKVFCSC